MIALCLATSLAGLLSGAALAHDLGYRVGLLFAATSVTGWDWQALALTAGLGLAALELAIRIFAGAESGP